MFKNKINNMDKVMRINVEFNKEIECFNLKETSEIRQLKLLIAGRFKLYDTSTISLLHEGKPIEIKSDSEILKNVFQLVNNKREKTLSTYDIQVMIVTPPKFEFNVSFQYSKKTISIKKENTLSDLLTEIKKCFIIKERFKLYMGSNIEDDLLENYIENDKLEDIFEEYQTKIDLKVVSCSLNNQSSFQSKMSMNQSMSSKQGNMQGSMQGSPKKDPKEPNLSLMNPSQFKSLALTCKCNYKSQATNVCFKCIEFICELCKNRSPHVNHQSEIIKLQKAKEYSKIQIDKLNVMIEENILKDENFKNMKTFECDLESEIETINSNFNSMKILLDEIKDVQINFLVELHKKMDFGDNFENINKKLDALSKSLNTFKKSNSELEIEEILNYMQTNVSETEKLIIDYKNLSNPFKVYSNSVESLDIMNSQFIKYLREKMIVHQANYSLSSLNSKLSTQFKRKYIYNNITI